LRVRRRPPGCTLFPYTTLFRSVGSRALPPLMEVVASGKPHAIPAIIDAIASIKPAPIPELVEALDDPRKMVKAAAIKCLVRIAQIGRAHAELQSRSDLVCRLLL